MKLVLLSWLALTLPTVAFSDVSLEAVEEREFGAWISSTYRNAESGALFCAAETVTPIHIIRINYYSPSNAFLEVLPAPSGMEEDATFVTFESESLSVRVIAIVSDGSLSIEMDKEKVAVGVLQTIAQARELRLVDKSGNLLIVVPSNGSKLAIDDLISCTRTIHLRQN